MSLLDKQSMYGPKSAQGQPGIGVAKPGSGTVNSPDPLASDGKGGLYQLSQIASTSLYDIDGKIKKYHP